MKKNPRNLLIVVLLLALVAAACGSDDDSTATIVEESEAADTTTVAPDIESSSPVTAGSELRVTEVDFLAGVATITNSGQESVDLTGHWLCNRPAYVELPGQALAAGEAIEVSIGGLTQDGGEVGLYTSGNFGNADDLVDYVTWGSGGGRLSVAEAAGLWVGEPVTADGDALSLLGTGEWG